MALVAAVLVAAMLCGSALAASYGAKALSASTVVYNAKNGTRVGTLKRGTSFTVTAISDGWTRISYKGHTGYVKLKDVVFNKHIKAVSNRSVSIKFITRESYKKGNYYTGTLAAGVELYLAGIRGDSYIFFDRTGDTMGMVSKSAVTTAS